MALTRPGLDMIDGAGTAAAVDTGTDAGEVPLIDDLLAQAIATEAEARAGVEATKRMTPLRTAQAIASLAGRMHRGAALDLSSGIGGEITDFGGLSDVDLIEVWLADVAVSGSDQLLIRIGNADPIADSGYVSASGAGSSSGHFSTATEGFVLYQATTGALWNGSMILRRHAGNTWIASHSMMATVSGTIISGGGRKLLAGPLDRVGIALTGANSFAGGAMQIFAGKDA